MPHHDGSRRHYARLPNNNDLVALWEANNRNATATAEVIGCSSAAVGQRLRRLGIETEGKSHRRPPPSSIPYDQKDLETLKNKVETLENTVRRLVNRVNELENAQNQPNGAQISHKRITDGGIHAHQQRKLLKTG